MHISSEILSAKFHAFESSVKSAVKNLFASLHSVSDIKMSGHKPAAGHKKLPGSFVARNLALDDDLNPSNQTPRFHGYTNNFRNTGEEALLLHGSTSGKFTVGNLAQPIIENGTYTMVGNRPRCRLDESQSQNLTAREFVDYLKEKSKEDNNIEIDLTKNSGPIHLISCYGKQKAAQDLADVTGRPVIAYSNQEVVCKDLMTIRRVEFTVDSNFKHKWDPRKLITGNEYHTATPKTFYPKENTVK
ncbi:hypothetical protein [Morganella morganii]|uniref:hypothetical protein n=1 Tax=Morganella morganii TaxID=582 RepID=UPI00164951DD|nr:hypothetical protein [Morganella morganii]MBC3960543.1 hypothetical protein [Morganella morganii]